MHVHTYMCQRTHMHRDDSLRWPSLQATLEINTFAQQFLFQLGQIAVSLVEHERLGIRGHVV